MIFFAGLIKIHLLPTCSLDRGTREECSVPNNATEVIELGNEGRTVAIGLSQFTADIETTIRSNNGVEYLKGGTSRLSKLSRPVICLLKSLRMGNADFWGILSVVVETRVDNINLINLTSRGIQFDIQFNVLTLRTNDLIGRRNCLIVTNTTLSDSNRINACNNRHVETLIGILSDNFGIDDYFVLCNQFVVCGGCDSAVGDVIDDFFSILCNRSTLDRLNLCASAETICSCIIKE